MKTVKLSLTPLLAAGMITACFASAQAQVIYWNFGASSEIYTPELDTISAYSSSAISQGNFLPAGDFITASNASNGYTIEVGDFTQPASGGNHAFASQLSSGSFSITSTSYLEFTLTPSAGEVVSLAYMGFGSRVINDPASPTSYSLRSSLDGYATEIAGGAFNTTSNIWRLYEEDFTFSGAVDQAITFRIYLPGGDGSSRSGTIRLDDLTLSSVPEPSTWLLLGFGVAALVAVRRHYKLAKQA